MTTFYEIVLTAMGAITLTFFLVVMTVMILGLEVLMTVKLYRWIVLRIRKAVQLPEAKILKPGIVWRVFERGLQRQPRMPQKAVKNGKAAAK